MVSMSGWHRYGAFYLLAVSAACSDVDAELGAGCYSGGSRAYQKIFFGEAWSALDAEGGTSYAIGSVKRCSGTLIGPDLMLTAKHCGIGQGAAFCVSKSGECRTVETTRESDEFDLAVAALVPGPGPSATTALAVSARLIGREWVGRLVELAGYGLDENGSSGELSYSVQQVVEVDDEHIIVDGFGERGACFGDSGGPLLAMGDQDGIQIVGVLSKGEASCVGRDHYTRVDVASSWIVSTAQSLGRDVCSFGPPR